MQTKTISESWVVTAYYLLIGLVAFQALSGIFGGFALVWDPSGALLRMPLSLLDGSPFEDYLFPGLILLLVLGFLPLLVVYGLWLRRGWSWTGALLVSLALLVWIGVEIAMVGYHGEPPLQLVYGITGLAMLLLALLSPVRRYTRGTPS